MANTVNGSSSGNTNSRVNEKYGENNINVGPLKEIPEICVDHFHKNSLKSNTFFLTHAHTDHMVGLEGPEFLKRLNDPGVILYCHYLTPMLLTSFDQYLGGTNGQAELILRRKLVPLFTHQPIKINIRRLNNEDDEYLKVKVTLLPAEHCPGSVMFLFETDSLCILHTGDFRQPASGLMSLRELHLQTNGSKEGLGPLKTIDHLYIDTTFCSKAYEIFPCRKEVIDKAIRHVQEWITGSSDNWIGIKFAAKFAHEYMLVSLYKAFKMRIHVTQRRHDIYKHIPVLCEVTTLSTNTPLHFCDDRNCREGQHLEMKLSSMWYILPQSTRTETISGYRPVAFKKTCDTVVRTPKRISVCYSMHSSMQEVIDAIEYLKPKVVTPLVMPVSSTLHNIKEAFRLHCKHTFTYEDYHTPSEVISPIKFEEDMVPVPDNSDSDQSQKIDESTSETTDIKFNRDPIEDLDKYDPVFQNFFELTPPKKRIRGKVFYDSTPPSSPSSSGGSSQKEILSQSSNHDTGPGPIEKSSQSESGIKRRKLCFSPRPCETSSDVKNLICDTPSSSIKSELQSQPSSSASSIKYLTTTTKISSQIEVITIEDGDDGSDTEFEIESNSSNSQNSIAA